MSQVTATRYHDFSAGHRVLGHEGKCQYLHGHNYRVHFTIAAQRLDDLGRVLDFGEIKGRLCNWLEDNWDHKTLLCVDDPLVAQAMDYADSGFTDFIDSLVIVDFNPTAENMALHLLEVVAPQRLARTGATLVKVVIEETRKCSCEVAL